jgi:anaerobic selenocysteine-containing dehydrogenase
MNAPTRPDAVYPRTLPSACPHDCPSTCALEVDVLSPTQIGRVRGAADNAYTDGVICAKVARYAERVHNPDRVLYPLMRVGPKGAGEFKRISWDEALDRVAEAFLKAEAAYGAEAVWPYYYAGTMGLVQRDGIHRLRHAKGYSGQFDTFCTNMAWTGYIAGTGKLAGPDPREIEKADCVVIWGTNAASTQINVLTHAVKARKARGAKIVAIDVYRTETVAQADMALILKPGTDGALACAVMHCLFRDGHADWDYLNRYADEPHAFAEHVKTKTPEWAAAITGLTVEAIEAFAALVGTTKKTFFRLGYGFSRSRNGAVNMHAASCIAVVTGGFQYEGGGAFHNNGAIYRLNKLMIEGLDVRDTKVRMLDQSRIGAVLTGDADALRGGPPVKAMLIQNTNPVSVAPEQALVKEGFAREDLFVVVHEQVMTETARMADIVLPAAMFVEYDDVYKGGGHQYIIWGGKLIEPAGEARDNHWVNSQIARRVGATHRGFDMTVREHVDWMLRHSGWPDLNNLIENRWIDCQPPFREAHYLDGFAYPDKKFRFAPDWPRVKAPNDGPMGPFRQMPRFPDHWEVIEAADEAHPFRLATSPARSFLNSTFNETPGSRKKEGRPTVKINPADAERLGITDGDRVQLSNARGAVILFAERFAGVLPGVVIAEGLWPNAAHEGGAGINTLTGADPVAPFGGAAFHDTKVAITKL